MSNKDKKFVLYKHTVPNEKIYIGITCESLNKRWRNGKGYLKNKEFYDDILLYGWDNIQHDILLENLTMNEACEAEKTYIKKYHSNDSKFGYNKTSGGEHTQFNESSKKLLSDFMQERWNNGFQAEALKEYYTDKRDTKYEGFLSNISCIDSDEHKCNKNFVRTKNNLGKKVICDGKVFLSVRACAEYLNINRRTLEQKLTGKRTITQQEKDYGLSFEGVECEYIPVKPKQTKVECDGKVFASGVEADRFFGLKIGTIGDWLSGRVALGPPKEFRDKGLKYVKDTRYKISIIN